MAFLLICLGWSSAFWTELNRDEFQLDALEAFGKEECKENKRKEKSFLDPATHSRFELAKRRGEWVIILLCRNFLKLDVFFQISCRAEISHLPLIMAWGFFSSPFSKFEGWNSVYLINWRAALVSACSHGSLDTKLMWWRWYLDTYF